MHDDTEKQPVKPGPKKPEQVKAAEAAMNPSLAWRQGKAGNQVDKQLERRSARGHALRKAGSSHGSPRPRRARRLVPLEWILLCVIVLAIAVTLAMAIFNPS